MSVSSSDDNTVNGDWWHRDFATRDRPPWLRCNGSDSGLSLFGIGWVGVTMPGSFSVINTATRPGKPE